ncbi:MAG: DciA family protein [Janthinobacterium lividum]
MKPVADDVNSLIRKIIVKKDPVLAEIIMNWAKIVGLKFSNNSSPFKISKSRENSFKINVLYIHVINSAISMEMSFQQDVIIERIIVYLGFKAIDKLRLVIN